MHKVAKVLQYIKALRLKGDNSDPNWSRHFLTGEISPKWEIKKIKSNEVFLRFSIARSWEFVLNKKFPGPYIWLQCVAKYIERQLKI
jgi:hypothetical protein